MANFFETSFVPQQPLVKVEAGGMGRREPLNIALIVALIIFFVTIAVAGGMYFWEKNTELRKNAIGQELADMEANFDIDKISSYKTLQATLRNARNLVNQHVIFSVVLDSVERNAAENVGLTNLSFSAAGDKSMLSLSGQAPSYKAVFFQLETWRGMKPIFQNVEVTSLGLSENSGIVDFNVKIDVDTKSLYFQKYVAAIAAAQIPIIPVVTASSTPLFPESPDKPETTTKATTTKK